MPRSTVDSGPETEPETGGKTWTWDAMTPLTLPGGELSATLSPDPGLEPDLQGAVLTVLLDPGHRTEAAHNRKALKRLWQQLAVPPWERRARPVVYWQRRPIAVAGYGTLPAYSARPGLRLHWLPITGEKQVHCSK